MRGSRSRDELATKPRDESRARTSLHCDRRVLRAIGCVARERRRTRAIRAMNGSKFACTRKIPKFFFTRVPSSCLGFVWNYARVARAVVTTARGECTAIPRQHVTERAFASTSVTRVALDVVSRVQSCEHTRTCMTRHWCLTFAIQCVCIAGDDGWRRRTRRVRPVGTFATTRPR